MNFGMLTYSQGELCKDLDILFAHSSQDAYHILQVPEWLHLLYYLWDLPSWVTPPFFSYTKQGGKRNKKNNQLLELFSFRYVSLMKLASRKGYS
ncbi:hypothetical protein VL06_20900 [Rossellomorea marisflavi]|nr:hypothetical protein VL06_20900 [Rossellomorea marisflavi]